MKAFIKNSIFGNNRDPCSQSKYLLLQTFTKYPGVFKNSYQFHIKGFKLRVLLVLSQATELDTYRDVSLNRNDSSAPNSNETLCFVDAEWCYLGRDFSSRQTVGGWPDRRWRRQGDSGQDRGQRALDETVTIFREIKFNCPVDVLFLLSQHDPLCLFCTFFSSVVMVTGDVDVRKGW